MHIEDRIYVAGHNGMVGRNLVEHLEEVGYKNIIFRTSNQLDLRDSVSTKEFFDQMNPDYVFFIAARVGGIQANINYPVEFLQDNLEIQTNIIKESAAHDVKKLLFLGSSCVYPRETPQPMKEDQILTGPFEPTNEGYAIAKVAGMKLCEYYNKQYGTNFISIIPPNLYGYYDHFGTQKSHVMSALITKAHKAKLEHQNSFEVWGTGSARREFMFVRDLSDAMVFLMKHYNDNLLLNVGTGEDIDIRSLAYLIKDIVGFDGEINFDTTKPDGMPQKLMNVDRLHKLGWKHKTLLKDGISKTYKWYVQ